MNRMSPANRCRPRFAQAEKPDLPGVDELGHGSDRLLDRHRAVDAVLVVQVDDVDVEALQGCVAGAVHVVGTAVDALRAIVQLLESELGGNDVLIATSGERLAHQLLVGEGPVHVGRVEHGDAQLRRASMVAIASRSSRSSAVP